MGITEKELRELLDIKVDVEKVTNLSSDGRNLLTRIPKKIREYLKLKKGDQFRWLVGDGKIEVKIVKNAKKKKENF